MHFGGLRQALRNPRVKAYFETLDLAVHEGRLLADGSLCGGRFFCSDRERLRGV